ncbi:hypothetical protein [Fibrobacter sp. UWB2]|uniref:hypothetical protein n=1 Tax=Fibrobacter sp. UWB2 TaxID=1964358 RepID=UPI001181D44F|nr:hypothetical protein [Fibrobacter sp. UWB2]
MNIVVPKFIDETQYAYWQVYILYSSFVGILHFGILDGIGLRYAGLDYDQLDKPLVRSQYQALFFADLLFAFIIAVFSYLRFSGEYKYIALLVAISIISKHLFTYNFYIFQITNRIKKYAAFIIVSNLICMLLTALFLLLSVNNYIFLCLIDIFCGIFSCFVFCKYNKGLYFGKFIPFKVFISEFKENISCGFILLIATWSSMLLLGSTKMFIQKNWDEILFGKISFAFSLTSLFLSFVTAVSIVLFPSLKRMAVTELPNMYLKIRNYLSPVLFSALVFYYPIFFILKKWIPKYEPSLIYLALILPIIVYTSKVTLLTNNYLKAYRKEKYLLVINVTMLVLSMICVGISTFILNNLKLTLLLAVFFVATRSIVSEVIVGRLINKRLTCFFIKEFILVVAFLVSANFFEPQIGFCIYLGCLFVYLTPYVKKIGCVKKLKKVS